MLYRNSIDTLPSNLYLAEQVRDGEKRVAKQLGIEMYQLMERAGHAVFEAILMYFPQVRHVAVICGAGNNGGDGYVVARLLLQSGIKVSVYAKEPDKNLEGDAGIAKHSFVDVGGVVLSHQEFLQLDNQNEPDVIIDALLGTGISGDLREDSKQLIEMMNSASAPIIAVDLPSGLDPDSGAVKTLAIQALITVNFVALKQGLFTALGPDYCGRLLFSGLGIYEAFAKVIQPSATTLSSKSIGSMPRRTQASHKGTFGHVLCFGGDLGMSGAIYLSGKAALRSGAGKVSIFCHPQNIHSVSCLSAELMVRSATLTDDEMIKRIQSVDVLVFGPGLGQSEWSKSLFSQLMRCLKHRNIPMVWDADALNLFAQNMLDTEEKREVKHSWVFTPHPLEAARLLGCSVQEVNQQRTESARKIAQKFGVTCVLKGAGTIVSDRSRTHINMSGNPGMATAGAGDVLTGIIAALLAAKNQSSDGFLDLVSKAVFLHGLAGDYAAKNSEIGIIASDVIDNLPNAINSLVEEEWFGSRIPD